MLKYLKLQKGALLAVAIASVALGVLMILFCRNNLPQLMIWCVAAAALVFGLIRIVRYFTGRGDAAQGVSATGERVSIDLAAGIAACVAALLLALFSRTLSSFIAFVLGAYVTVDGLLSLSNALKLKKMQFGQWKTVMILSVTMLALGVLMIVLPNILPINENYNIICNIALGAGLLVNGGINLWTVYCLHKTGSAIIERK